MSADRLIIILLSPALAFILTLTDVSFFTSYFLTPYTQAYLLLVMILLRSLVSARGHRYGLYERLPTKRAGVEPIAPHGNYDSSISQFHVFNKQVLKVIMCLTGLCLIEYAHIFLGRDAFEGLVDPRMLLYSPFYGSIIVFVLYCIYLLISSERVRRFHVAFTLQVITVFSLFFIGYWLLLYLGLAPESEGRNFKNANGVSYYALFACFLILIKNDFFYVKYSNFCFLINLSVILLNTTRGAILILGLVFAYNFITSRSVGAGKMLLFVMPVFVVVVGLIINIQVLLGDTFFILFDYVAKTDLQDIILAGDNYISSLGDYRLGDDGSISSVSRIFVNYFAFLNFVNHPWLGVGQTESYMLNIFGAGIHSFQFMLISTGGLFGLVIFTYLVHSLHQYHESPERRFLLNCFIFSVLIFTNTIPIYFSLIPFMPTILYANDFKHGDQNV